MATDAQQQDDAERDRVSSPVRQGRRRWSRSARLSAGAALLLSVLLLVSAFVVQPFLIPSSSMAPTLKVGDRILVNKLAYRIGNSPGRGDVVVFDGRESFVQEEGDDGSPVTGFVRKAGAAVGLMRPEETDYVKRVIGVGGDRVRCCDRRGRIEVNGVPLDEDYLHEGDDPSAVPFDIEVPQGRLWVMGDHRSDSSDSRAHLGDPGGGTVPVERVIGRADGIGWPMERWGSVQSTEAGAHG
ncbi:signal peptidase I [Streptomyces sp. WMMB 714]|jgi:signal peptidase I|uniref:signal peptidase I n=1 Tax=Streptomyces sp. WMMB 714 TaxID=1286822 RepID=UPI0005F8305E|nr:signal peptidase I [Streptomyces sp. WMMB 714]SCK36684.1 signal peptidase I [Streptomyces sp. WMMB 714]